MIQKRTRCTSAVLAIGLAGTLLVGCGDDGDDDNIVGGQNAPGSDQTATTVDDESEAAPAGDNQPTEVTGSSGRREIKIVDSTPVTRSGSDGSMAQNGPGASPAASPEATPAS